VNLLDDDWQLLERAIRRDETAWCILSDRYRPRLLGLAFVITSSRAAAEDIAQEAFVTILRKPPRRSADSIMPYLATAAYRLALKEVARRRRLTCMEGVEVVDESAKPFDSIEREEAHREIGSAIRALSAEHREVIALRFQGEMSYEEIAKSLNVPLGTVKSRIFNAVKQCREYLKQKGI